MKKTLRIAMTVDPEIPVPPTFYGGIERVVDMLVKGLVKRGHQVTLFANKESRVPCELIPYPGESSLSIVDTYKNMKLVTQKIWGGQYDLVHSHSRLAYLLPLLPAKIPKIMTYQRTISPRSVILGNLLSCESLHFTSVSKHLMKPVEKYATWHVIYNGVEMEKFKFSPDVPSHAPLIFLGRIEHVKGAHLAIEIAKKSGRKLIIAGNIEDAHQAYYDEKIAPWLDGDQISYIGSVDDESKIELLGKGAALLMPIQFDDPCPVVLSEALACGTPVIGLRRGAIPEIVEEGRNGFICNSVDEMVVAVRNIPRLDRMICRKSAEMRFSENAIVGQYESLYFTMVNRFKQDKLGR